MSMPKSESEPSTHRPMIRALTLYGQGISLSFTKLLKYKILFYKLIVNYFNIKNVQLKTKFQKDK